MSTPSRKIAAILAADVAGYSKLMGEDETGTLDALRELRQGLFQPTISEHHGEVVKSMGDGWLVEFASVVDAVNCALQIQESLAGHEIIKLRIGVHIGDIVHEDEDIYGDGVNIAARLQEISEPGGIALSGRARDFLDGKLAGIFHDAGEQELKNIAESVRVFVSGDGETDQSPSHGAPPPPSDKPSIAVLPFDNLSGDPEQEYFADGISEDIITALSHLPWFFVVARNSSFAFKGRATDVKQLARELGVRYLVEGSVRKAGNRVRITAQLIDARQDRHIWADRYDRDLTDVFAVQDEITEKIAGAVAPEFMAAEMLRARGKEARDLDAWDLLMQAHWHFNLFTKESNQEAKVLLEKSIALDPNSDLALSDLASCHLLGLMWNWYDEPAKALEASRQAAQKAIAINDRNVAALQCLANIDAISQKFDAAVSKARRALSLAPNSPDAHGTLGGCLTLACEWEEAMEELNTAIHLGPRNPMNAMWYTFMQVCLFQERRYEECIQWCDDAIKDLPNTLPAVHRPMAASYAMLERMDEARAAMKLFKSRVPGASAETTRSFPFKDASASEHYVEALFKAETSA
jgi:TolB-like protein/Tfp pilus assembly protein PilF